VSDLDGDGRVEIVVSHEDVLPPVSTPYRGVRLLDGPTGRACWDKPIWRGPKTIADGVVQVLEAPDLDTDGTRDVIAVSRFGSRVPADPTFPEPEGARVYVDALSGKDGRTLWTWKSDALHDDTTPIRPAFWWGRGPDGWPMLALPTGGHGHAIGVARVPGRPPLDPHVVHLLAAATGIEAHSIPGLSSPRAADFNGDGLPDLWGSVDGKLRAFRAQAPEGWRAVGTLERAGDLDRDGITDVVTSDLTAPEAARGAKPESRTALARSGRDGRVLWRARLEPWAEWLPRGKFATSYSLVSSPGPGADLDGDGTPDVFVKGAADAPLFERRHSSALQLKALSGRTGRLLWSAESPWPVPPSGSRSTVVMGSSYGIDGATGRPIWQFDFGRKRSILAESDGEGLARLLEGPKVRRSVTWRCRSRPAASSNHHKARRPKPKRRATSRAGCARSRGLGRSSLMRTRSCNWPWAPRF
jgi:hypothetical protein